MGVLTANASDLAGLERIGLGEPYRLDLNPDDRITLEPLMRRLAECGRSERLASRAMVWTLAAFRQHDLVTELTDTIRVHVSERPLLVSVTHPFMGDPGGVVVAAVQAVLEGDGAWILSFLREVPEEPDVSGLQQALTLWRADRRGGAIGKEPVVYDDGQLGVEITRGRGEDGVFGWVDGRVMTTGRLRRAVRDGAGRQSGQGTIVVVAMPVGMSPPIEPVLRTLYGAPWSSGASTPGGAARYPPVGDGLLRRLPDVPAVCLMGLADIGEPVEIRTLHNPWSQFVAPVLPGITLQVVEAVTPGHTLQWNGGDARWRPSR